MSETGKAYLILEGTVERRIDLTAERPCGIGRSEGNVIVLKSDEMASRSHALIQAARNGKVFLLTDLGSMNGTLLNGTRVTTPMELKEGDRVQIGNQRMVFHQAAATEPDTHMTEIEMTRVEVRTRSITVLVVDIRDFTGMSRRIGSEKLGEVAGFLFREAGRILQQRGAWTQKYIGDAVMAVWQHDKKAEIADFLPVFTAILELSHLATSLAAKFGLREAIRIGSGINTGMASTGNFGSAAASDHTALGDTVNKAFRLESCTKEIQYDLAIGPDVFNALSPGVADLLSPVVARLKGYPEPETVYAIQFNALDGLVKALSEESGKPTPTS